jgi:hypothetical protein
MRIEEIMDVGHIRQNTGTIISELAICLNDYQILNGTTEFKNRKTACTCFFADYLN